MTITLLYRLVAVALVAGMGVENLFLRHKPPSVQNYHANIRAAAAIVPPRIGPWVGHDIPVLARALNLLQPNAMINRQYINVEDGRSIGFLAEHCGDAHDMVGHYPLRCYPADGWDLQSSRELNWTIGGLTMIGMEYTFVLPPAHPGDFTHTITIDNFLLRPNGQILPDMDALSKSILGAYGQATGAGQIQVYFTDSTMSPAEREAIFRRFMDGYRPFVEAVLAHIPS